MKLEGNLPVIRMTATILPGRITNRVKIHGPMGGGAGGRRTQPAMRDSSVARRATTGDLRGPRGPRPPRPGRRSQ